MDTEKITNPEESLQSKQPHNETSTENSFSEGQEALFDEKTLKACKQSLAEWQEKFARLSADFENYKKRLSREQASWKQLAQIQVLTDLLPIIDNFERAMTHVDTVRSKSDESWVDGIAMIYSSFLDYLQKVGIKEVSYQTFDPVFHEALMHVESPDHKSGEIVQIMEKGYLLGDRVLRPAKISVAK